MSQLWSVLLLYTVDCQIEKCLIGWVEETTKYVYEEEKNLTPILENYHFSVIVWEWGERGDDLFGKVVKIILLKKVNSKIIVINLNIYNDENMKRLDVKECLIIVK